MKLLTHFKSITAEKPAPVICEYCGRHILESKCLTLTYSAWVEYFHIDGKCAHDAMRRVRLLRSKPAA